MAQSADDAARQRIVTHMNADHHDSIIRYLEHYAKLPSWTAYNGLLTGIELDGMTIDCNGKAYQIPLNPPMKSFRDARERVVEMDRECLQALGKSEITVKEFILPTGLQWVIFAIILATFIGYSQRYWFEMGGVVEQIFGSRFAAFSWTIQPGLITFMVLIHAAELAYFTRSRLRKHSVNVRTVLFWKWCVFVYVEGMFAFARFDGLVRRKMEAKEKQKH